MKRNFASCLPSAMTVAVIVTSCTPRPDERSDGLSRLFSDDMAVVDLTYAVSADAPFWPGPDRSPFRHDTLAAHPDGSPSMAAYSVPEHFGTHFDAPVHGGQGLPSVDRVAVSQLFGPAVVLDVAAQAADDADYAATVADAQQWETMYGRIPQGAIVLVRAGWGTRWGEGASYYNADPEGRLHFPGFSPQLAAFLVEERGVAGIGIDTGSVDPGAADGFPAHGTVNGSGGFHLENVANLEAVPEAGAYLIVAPIKIEGGSGGQVRIFAVLPPSMSR
jgi:kynurenine formamidase